MKNVVGQVAEVQAEYEVGKRLMSLFLFLCFSRQRCCFFVCFFTFFLSSARATFYCKNDIFFCLGVPLIFSLLFMFSFTSHQRTDESTLPMVSDLKKRATLSIWHWQWLSIVSLLLENHFLHIRMEYYFVNNVSRVLNSILTTTLRVTKGGRLRRKSQCDHDGLNVIIAWSGMADRQ